MQILKGKTIGFMVIGGVLGGLVGAGIGYVLYNVVWWLWGAVIAPTFTPQYAFIYQGPPDPQPRLWWIIGGALLVAAIGLFTGYSPNEKPQSQDKSKTIDTRTSARC